MLIHIFGWLSLIGVSYATLLYFFNMFNPHQRDNRLILHCNISKITIPTTSAHIVFQPLNEISNQWILWSGLGLYLIIMLSGIVLMYLPRAGKLRYHARTLHPALLVGLWVVLLWHVF